MFNNKQSKRQGVKMPCALYQIYTILYNLLTRLDVSTRYVNCSNPVGNLLALTYDFKYYFSTRLYPLAFVVNGKTVTTWWLLLVSHKQEFTKAL